MLFWIEFLRFIYRQMESLMKKKLGEVLLANSQGPTSWVFSHPSIHSKISLWINKIVLKMLVVVKKR